MKKVEPAPKQGRRPKGVEPAYEPATVRAEKSRLRDAEAGISSVRVTLRLKGEAADAFKKLTKKELPTDLIRRLLFQELDAKR